jgi:hemerythrin-like metal-binding protein
MQKLTCTIAWNDEMSVGIPEIDADHKNFILLINDFNWSITGGNNPDVIKQRLHLIIDDAVQHFAHEERLFKEWQYINLEDHAKTHANVLKKLNEIMSNFTPYGHDTGWVTAGLEIKNILINHMMTDDMKYMECYQALTVAAGT